MSSMGLSIKKYLPRTLFGRSLVILVVPVVLIQAVTTFMFLDRHWSKVTARLAYAVAGEVVMLADMVETSPEDPQVKKARRYLDLEAVFKPDEHISQTSVKQARYGWESMVAKRLVDELESVSVRPFIVDLNLKRKHVQVLMQLENGVLDITFPGRRLFSSSTYIFLLWMFGTSLLLLVVAVLFMRGQVRPIRRLAVFANRFGTGQEIPAFKPSGAYEVRQAAEAFISMQRRIKRQIEQRTLMLAGISHDLRTPLTRLKLNLEMLGDSTDLKAMQGDIKDMEHMIQAYLDFVRGDHGEDVQAVNVNMFVEQVVQDVHRVHGKNIRLNVETKPLDLGFLNIRSGSLRRCIMNLIDNAARYGKTVWFSAQKTDEYMHFIVEDDGPGLDENEYEAVLRPFYRVDNSRDLTGGHSGLGLSISQDVAHAHGGTLIFDKSIHGGLKVTVRLPL